MNYFLGFNVVSGVYTLAADFEEGAGQLQPGQNHALISPTTINDNTWYHAAATYDSSSGFFAIYLNGVLNTSVTLGPGRAPRFDSTQYASIATAMTSGGTAQGFFNGSVDEVRIWNVARTQAEIAANMNLEVAPSPELIGRWGFNEGAGAVAFNSVAGRPHGTLTNTPPRVVGAVPIDAVAPPAPQDVAAHVGNGVVTISWPDNSALDLSGYNVYRNGSATPLNVGVLNALSILTTPSPTARNTATPSEQSTRPATSRRYQRPSSQLP